MPLRPFSRDQAWLLPPTLNDFLPPDHPARFVAVVLDEQEVELEDDLEGDPLGAPAYHPRALLAIWVYGFMTGVRSSRRLEAACRDRTLDAEGLRRLLARTEAAIGELEAENATGGDPPPPRLPEELVRQQALREPVLVALDRYRGRMRPNGST